MPTLLNITDDMLALDAILEEVGGDVSGHEETVASWIDELTANLGRKAEGYAALIVELNNRAEFRRAEAKRLVDRAKIDERKADWLKQTLMNAMRMRGESVIETERFRLSVQRNGGKQPMELIGDVPTAWCNVEVVQTPDKDRIREALENCVPEVSEFAQLLERGERLVIR